MAVYTHDSRVRAPLSEVWAFHSRAEGLEALTPSFLHLRVEESRGPDGESDPEVFEEGTEISTSVQPFGVGPRQRWTSRIVEREAGEEVAYFVDRMVEGPFVRWEHAHRFVAEGEETRIHDRVDWVLPGGIAGRVAAHLGVLGLEPTFRYRHRRARALLE